MPSGPNSRWNSSAAAVTSPTLTWSARTRKKPVVSTDTSPTASAMFIVEANRKNARMAVSAASTARREARSTTAVCRASIPYACTVGAPCRTFITCWVRSPAATRLLGVQRTGRRQEPPQPERVHGKTSRKASASRQSSVAKPTKVSTTVTSEVKTPAATRTEVLTSSTSSVTREVTSPVPARSRVAESIRSALSITCSRRSAAIVMPSWSL